MYKFGAFGTTSAHAVILLTVQLEDVEFVVDIIFSSDSRHLVSFAEFNVKLTIWSLIEKRTRYIKFPKARECVKFSEDGQFLAVVERRNGRDCVSLFSATGTVIVFRELE